MTDDFLEEPSRDEPVPLARMAREEFRIMARVYFAPIFGTGFLLRRLLRIAGRVDDRALSQARADRWIMPAE